MSRYMKADDYAYTGQQLDYHQINRSHPSVNYSGFSQPSTSIFHASPSYRPTSQASDAIQGEHLTTNAAIKAESSVSAFQPRDTTDPEAPSAAFVGLPSTFSPSSVLSPPVIEGDAGQMLQIPVQLDPNFHAESCTFILHFGSSSQSKCDLQPLQHFSSSISRRLLSVEVPDLGSASLTMNLVLEIMSENSMSEQKNVGMFRYGSQSYQSYPAAGKRKHSDYSEDDAGLVGSSHPQKRVANQPLRNRNLSSGGSTGIDPLNDFRSFYTHQGHGHRLGPRYSGESSSIRPGFEYSPNETMRPLSPIIPTAADSLPSPPPPLPPSSVPPRPPLTPPTIPSHVPFASISTSSNGVAAPTRRIGSSSLVAAVSNSLSYTQSTLSNLSHYTPQSPRPNALRSLAIAPPTLIRTSMANRQASLATADVPSFNPYSVYSGSKAKLKISGDLMSMTKHWNSDEMIAQRRLVEFERSQTGNTIEAKFKEVSPSDRAPSNPCISCIWWERKQQYYCTSVDTIMLLEALVSVTFTVEEKNRIRRNLEGFKPYTVSKTKTECEDIFRLIMGYPSPKPRNIEKDIKIFYWSHLEQALRKIISKYSASYSSTSSVLVPPTPATTSYSTALSQLSLPLPSSNALSLMASFPDMTPSHALLSSNDSRNRILESNIHGHHMNNLDQNQNQNHHNHSESDNHNYNRTTNNQISSHLGGVSLSGNDYYLNLYPNSRLQPTQHHSQQQQQQQEQSHWSPNPYINIGHLLGHPRNQITGVATNGSSFVQNPSNSGINIANMHRHQMNETGSNDSRNLQYQNHHHTSPRAG